jgi:hypothetical protein
MERRHSGGVPTEPAPAVKYVLIVRIRFTLSAVSFTLFCETSQNPKIIIKIFAQFTRNFQNT